jgi:hypothetical protein
MKMLLLIYVFFRIKSRKNSKDPLKRDTPAFTINPLTGLINTWRKQLKRGASTEKSRPTLTCLLFALKTAARKTRSVLTFN